jgi:NADH:ubiquinone oxidoreductase subunit E
MTAESKSIQKNCTQDSSSNSEQEKFEILENVIKHFEFNPNNLIQILHNAQNLFGCIPLDVQKFVSEKMKIPISKISGVITFYSYFSTQPKGEYVISVCMGTACYVRGGKKLLEKLKELLDLDLGGTTEDGKFSLEIMRCAGACGLAPVITVNGKVYKQVNPNKLHNIIGLYQ